jgi:hypothetical protein
VVALLRLNYERVCGTPLRAVGSTLRHGRPEVVLGRAADDLPA